MDIVMVIIVYYKFRYQMSFSNFSKVGSWDIINTQFCDLDH